MNLMSSIPDSDPGPIAAVVAFDPGETTGWCIMGVPAILMPIGIKENNELHNNLDVLDYGEIDCGGKKGHTGRGSNRGHDLLNFSGEDHGIDRMLSKVLLKPEDPILFEDFILDFNQATSGRDTLSPVRVTYKFSYGLRHQFLEHHEGTREPEERIFLQNRTLAKTTCTNERLKYWGLYDRKSGEHARDAIRLAYYFLRDHCGNSFTHQNKRFLAWPHLFPDPEIRERQGRTAPGVPKPVPQQARKRVTGLG